jgi:hypothetical protein
MVQLSATKCSCIAIFCASLETCRHNPLCWFSTSVYRCCYCCCCCCCCLFRYRLSPETFGYTPGPKVWHITGKEGILRTLQPRVLIEWAPEPPCMCSHESKLFVPAGNRTPVVQLTVHPGLSPSTGFKFQLDVLQKVHFGYLEDNIKMDHTKMGLEGRVMDWNGSGLAPEIEMCSEDESSDWIGIGTLFKVINNPSLWGSRHRGTKDGHTHSEANHRYTNIVLDTVSCKRYIWHTWPFGSSIYSRNVV